MQTYQGSVETIFCNALCLYCVYIYLFELKIMIGNKQFEMFALLLMLQCDQIHISLDL